MILSALADSSADMFCFRIWNKRSVSGSLNWMLFDFAEFMAESRNGIFYETLLFAVQRGFEVPYSMYETLRDTVKAEVADYRESPYAAMIPRQMELYRIEEKLTDENRLNEYIKEHWKQ